MKRYLRMLIVTAMLVSMLACAAFAEGEKNESVYIEGIPVSYMENNGKYFVSLDELENMGFDIIKNEKTGSLKLVEDYTEYLNPTKRDNYRLDPVYLSEDVLISIGRREFSSANEGGTIENEMRETGIPLYSYQGKRYIDVDYFAYLAEPASGYGPGIKKVALYGQHRISPGKNATVEVERREDGIYYNGDRVGFRKDNVDMMDLAYFAKMLGFEGGGKSEESRLIEFGQKGDYRFELIIDNEIRSYYARTYYDGHRIDDSSRLLLKPEQVEDAIYISSVDVSNLMNVDFMFKQEATFAQTSGTGEYGRDVVSHDGYVYASDHMKEEIYKIDGNNKTQVFAKVKANALAVSGNYLYCRYATYYDAETLKRISLTTGSVEDVVSNVEYFTVVQEKLYVQRVFAESDEMQRKTGIYECTVDGDDVKLLLEGRYMYLNIKGDVLYFTSREDANCIYSYDLNSKIYTKLTDYYAENLKVVGDKLVYSNDRGAHMMNLDGTDSMKISNVEVSDIYLDGGYVYAEDFKDVYRYKIGSMKKEKVYSGENYIDGLAFDEEERFVVSDFPFKKYTYKDLLTDKETSVEKEDIVGVSHFDGEKLYYKNGEDRKLRAYDVESKDEKILDEEIYFMVGVWSDYVYYFAGEDGQVFVKRIDKNTQKVEKLEDVRPAMTYMDVNDDGIYYLEYDENEDMSFVRVGHDGKDKKVLLQGDESGSHNGICYHDGYIYFNGYEKTIRIDEKSLEKKDLGDIGKILAFEDDRIYTYKDNALSSMNIDGEDVKRVLNQIKRTPLVIGGKVFSYAGVGIDVFDMESGSKKTVDMRTNRYQMRYYDEENLYVTTEDGKLLSIDVSDLSVEFILEGGEKMKVNLIPGENSIALYQVDKIKRIKKID